MRDVREIIDELKEIADHPRRALEAWKKETGKGAVGVMPVYCPEEIVHAAGCLPIGIWGGHTQISKARAYLPPFACSIMQSVMELQLEGTYDELDAVIFSGPCDTLKCMNQKWHGKCPAIVFTHPQNRKIAAAVPFLKKEYENVKAELEKILGTTISDEAINESIEVYNENRRTMRAFSDMAAEYPQIISPADRHAVIKARWFMDKAKHTKLVQELMNVLNNVEKEPWTGKKCIVTGIMLEPYEVCDILADNGFAIVADDLAQESRQFRADIPNGNDPLERLAQWWSDFDGCALATDPKKPRGQMLIDAAKKYGADAIIVAMMKFCDPEEFDYPIYIQEFDKAGIRYIKIEIDQESTSFEQIKTRVQTFAEIL